MLLAFQIIVCINHGDYRQVHGLARLSCVTPSNRETAFLAAGNVAAAVNRRSAMVSQIDHDYGAILTPSTAHIIYYACIECSHSALQEQSTAMKRKHNL